VTFSLFDLAFVGSLTSESPAVEGFSSLTFGGPFYIGGWSIGVAGQNLFGVAIRGAGADEPIHNASGSIM